MRKLSSAVSKSLPRWISGGFCLALAVMTCGLCTGCVNELLALEDLLVGGESADQGWGGYAGDYSDYSGGGYTAGDALSTYLGNFIEYN